MAFARTIFVIVGIALFSASAGSAAASTSPGTSVSHAATHVCSAVPIVRGHAWQLEYSFGGSIVPGVGTVHITLPSTGSTTVTTKYRENPTHVKHVQLPPKAVAKVAKVLAKWPPACIHTLTRKGYYVADIGHTEIKFTTGGHSTTAVVGPCKYVDNGEAFGAIYDAVASLKPYLGDAATWSAMMSTPIKGDACKAQSPAPNMSFACMDTHCFAKLSQHKVVMSGYFSLSSKRLPMKFPQGMWGIQCGYF